MEGVSETALGPVGVGYSLPASFHLARPPRTPHGSSPVHGRPPFKSSVVTAAHRAPLQSPPHFL